METKENTIILKKPINAHGEDITELTLREPNGEDVRANGYPFTTNAEGQVILLGEPIFKYISTLAGIPPSSVKEIHATDMHKLGWMVATFFLQD